MAWYESKVSGEKEYVFGQGGGARLTEELRTELLGQIPLGQPDWNETDFAPSVYAEDSEIGKIYLQVADTVIEKTKK